MFVHRCQSDLNIFLFALAGFRRDEYIREKIHRLLKIYTHLGPACSGIAAGSYADVCAERMVHGVQTMQRTARYIKARSSKNVRGARVAREKEDRRLRAA